MSRGILTTHFVRLKKSKSLSELLGLYQEVYSGEPFVRILPEGELSHTHHVRGTNVCEISLASSSSGKRLIVFTALDNLVKGAAGQAIQNMNLMMGYEESLGLKIPGLYP
jgi:N-acetyl-gamma-glutamyl-phosphate reductase